MSQIPPEDDLPSDLLLEVIRLQTEIAKLGLDLGGVMDLVTANMSGLTGSEGAILELTEGEEMVYRSVSGMASGQLGLRLARSGSLSGLCVESGTILRCDDCEHDPRVDKQACRRVGLRSMVVAPLFHDKTVVGVLKVASPRPGHFTARHVRILELMTELIASAMFFAARFDVKDLYHQATHDTLTGLANRALFYDRLRQGLALARRAQTCLGVINLDMDGLKYINDTFGHRAGDAAICELASRTRSAARQSDTVARLGGDEFGVLLPEVDDRQNAQTAAERIASAIRQPFAYENTPLPLDASIGLAVYPADAQEPDDLVEQADKAMYRVKRQHKGARPEQGEE